MAPTRTWGLPWHMIYPSSCLVLISVSAFASSKSIWLVSANSPTTQIRFGPQDFCGFNRTSMEGTVTYSALGCVYGGTSYTIAASEVGMVLPDSVTYSLSRCAAILYLCFALLLLAITNQAYATFYSYGPDPKKDKQVTLIGIHFILTFATTLSIWLTIFVLLVCCGVSVNNVDVANQGTSIWWGQTSWIVLTAAVLSPVWAYEAVRWRRILLLKE